MAQYSIGVQVAWQVGGYEAANKKSTEIEVDHIMLGILSLDKIQDLTENQSKKNLEGLIKEKETLYAILISNNIEITTTRRKLRLMLPEGITQHVDSVLHRSEECKKMFNEAACIGNNFLKISHLFITILGWQTSIARNLFISENIDIERLKSEIMFSFYRKN